MARTYIISEICGDWALQIREPGHPHQFLYFNSENNADLVKSILEWEDAHPNEAVPYNPTLTPPNEPLTCRGCMHAPDCPSGIHCYGCARLYADNYRRPPEVQS